MRGRPILCILAAMALVAGFSRDAAPQSPDLSAITDPKRYEPFAGNYRLGRAVFSPSVPSLKTATG